MSKKKILVYGFTYNMGGIECFYMNYYRRLDKEEYQIDFIKSYDKIAFEEELVANGSRMYRLPKYNKNPIRFYSEMVKLLKKENYDVFHANMLTAANILHLKAAKKCGVKTIIAHSHNGDFKGNQIQKVLHYLNRSFIKYDANKLVTCSKVAAKWLFGNQNHVILLNNAIDLKQYLFQEAIRKEMRKELNIKENAFVMGHVGRFNEQKNHKFLLDILTEVYAKNKDVMLVLVGTGSLEEEIRRQVKERKLEKNVIFLGKRNDVNRVYQAFDMFLLPSLYEGLPVVGIEAQVNGLPCIFSDKITEEITINANVYRIGIGKENLEKWREKILEIKENNKRCTDLRKIYENYNIDCEIEKFKELYEDER